MASTDIALRIIIVQPPAGVMWAVQRGRDDLIAPAHQSPDEIVFDVTARLGRPRAGGMPNLLGDVTQGPPDRRFIYVNAGQLAGQADSCWQRRAKVFLRGIDSAMVDAVLAVPGTRLEARMQGTGARGGPACATVPLLDGGWRVVGGRTRKERTS